MRIENKNMPFYAPQADQGCGKLSVEEALRVLNNRHIGLKDPCLLEAGGVILRSGQFRTGHSEPVTLADGSRGVLNFPDILVLETPDRVRGGIAIAPLGKAVKK